MAAVLLFTLVIGFLPVGVLPASAHAIVLESVPARDAVLARSPQQVILRFNSKIEKRLTRVTLSAAGGAPMPLSIADDGRGDDQPDRLVLPLRTLSPGSYVLRYKVLSADGHITEGALRFTVTGR
jgi:methionine-rich copper-binding protein CopC